MDIGRALGRPQRYDRLPGARPFEECLKSRCGVRTATSEGAPRAAKSLRLSRWSVASSWHRRHWRFSNASLQSWLHFVTFQVPSPARGNNTVTTGHGPEFCLKLEAEMIKHGHLRHANTRINGPTTKTFEKLWKEKVRVIYETRQNAQSSGNVRSEPTTHMDIERDEVVRRGSESRSAGMIRKSTKLNLYHESPGEDNGQGCTASGSKSVGSVWWVDRGTPLLLTK